jgi:hypothetical protein
MSGAHRRADQGGGCDPACGGRHLVDHAVLADNELFKLLLRASSGQPAREMVVARGFGAK